jgi:hypothetical protein
MSAKRKLRKEDPGKVRIFSDVELFITDAQVNCHKSSYLPGLPMSDVEKNIRVSPFSKVPAKVKVLGVLESNVKMCSIIVLNVEGVTVESHRSYFARVTSSSRTAHLRHFNPAVRGVNMAVHWSVRATELSELNPLDYCIWDVLQVDVHNNPTFHPNKDSLR